MKKYFLVYTLLLLSASIINAQQRQAITVEDIWTKAAFWPEAPRGMTWFDDQHYSSISDNQIVKTDAVNGRKLAVLFENKDGLKIDEYFFSEDKKKILIATGTEPIYRHSFKALFYLVNTEDGTVRKVYPEKISNPSFSPDGKKISFISENNLYVTNTSDLQTIAISTEGEINKIIVGATDWVYEEEFSFTKAYAWSPDSRRIGFLVFDESKVDEYTLQYWNSLYPQNYTYKYPKAGTENSTVTVHSYHIETRKRTQYPIPNDSAYFPRINWTQDSLLMSIQRLNRKQSHFQLLHVNAKTQEVKVAYEEICNNYVEITDDLKYLKDGKHFLLTSEKDGYKHLYKYSMEGKLAAQITKGNWDIDHINGIDEKSAIVYYTSTEVSPVQRHLYQVDLNGKKKKRLSERSGTHDAEFSPAFKYYIHTWSDLNSPPVYSLAETKTGKSVKTIISNEQMKNTFEHYRISKGEFFQYTTENGVTLNGYMIKPVDFDPGKKYPLLVNVYGGPGIQVATDAWKGPNYFWFQSLADKGYIIISIDNRGTGGRGADFKKCTQNQLGKFESEDVINTAKYLRTLPFIEGSRIGIFGWSFGGYLASLAMTVGADYFKMGIAVAPVISWRFYDTIYTERFLGLPQENPEGYDKNSPLSYAERLKGKYLLIHGTADDNVHVQNAFMMQQALIEAGKQFDVFYYPDRNHGIYGGNTRLHLYSMITNYIVKNL